MVSPCLEGRRGQLISAPQQRIPAPCVIPGLQNKTETNKSNLRLDLSCLEIIDPHQIPIILNMDPTLRDGKCIIIRIFNLVKVCQ